MRRKNVVCIALSFVILLGVAIIPSDNTEAKYLPTASAVSEEPVTPNESEFEYKLLPLNNPKRAALTKYKGNASQIIVPQSVGGYPVEIISANAFADSENLTYIKLPKTLSSIAGNAFKNCPKLAVIDISAESSRFASIDGVLYGKEIDESSPDFGKAVSLKVYPAGKGDSFTVPYGIKSIGTYAFSYCYNLKSINMYNTVTEIGAYAFSYCWGLESIRLSDNLKTIGSYVLYSCTSLKTLYLPATVTSIGNDAFLGGIDSNDNKFYYFNGGVYCTEGTYTYDYLIDQHLPPSIIKPKHRSITDIDTGITFTDAYSVLPKEEYFDLRVAPVETQEVESLFPVRYNQAFAYDIFLISENATKYTPNGHFVISFDEIGKTAIPSATKIYKVSGTRAIPVNGAPNTPFVGTQITSTGRFIVLTNNDFSLKGDIDGDGKITLYDARASLYLATGLMTLGKEQTKAANVDNSADGKISTQDTRLILRRAAGIINEF